MIGLWKNKSYCLVGREAGNYIEYRDGVVKKYMLEQ